MTFLTKSQLKKASEEIEKILLNLLIWNINF